MLGKLFRSMTRKSPRRSQSQPRRLGVKLNLEGLEDRTVPAVTATFNNGVLFLVDANDGAADVVTVTQTGGTINVTGVGATTVNGQLAGVAVPFNGVNFINVNFKGGSDSVTFNTLNITGSIVASMGLGDDTIQFAGLTNVGNVFINGGDGNNTVAAADGGTYGHVNIFNGNGFQVVNLQTTAVANLTINAGMTVVNGVNTTGTPNTINIGSGVVGTVAINNGHFIYYDHFLSTQNTAITFGALNTNVAGGISVYTAGGNDDLVFNGNANLGLFLLYYGGTGANDLLTGLAATDTFDAAGVTVVHNTNTTATPNVTRIGAGAGVTGALTLDLLFLYTDSPFSTAGSNIVINSPANLGGISVVTSGGADTFTLGATTAVQAVSQVGGFGITFLAMGNGANTVNVGDVTFNSGVQYFGGNGVDTVNIDTGAATNRRAIFNGLVGVALGAGDDTLNAGVVGQLTDGAAINALAFLDGDYIFNSGQNDTLATGFDAAGNVTVARGNQINFGTTFIRNFEIFV